MQEMKQNQCKLQAFCIISVFIDKQWNESYQWKQKTTIKQNLELVFSSIGIEISSIEIIVQYEVQRSECKWSFFDSFCNCAFGIYVNSVSEADQLKI